MANYLPGQPNTDYDFGQEFDYSLWTPGTQIDLVNVPWNNDYRDVVRFTSRTALGVYIDSLEPAGIRIEQMSYVKPNEPVRVNIPHNRAQKYNYLRAISNAQPVPGNDVPKRYYYFILDTKYVAPNTTELILQLDVWQTFIYDITIGRCYVERGHIGIANENQYDNYGRNYLTHPEGLDTGTDLRIQYTKSEIVATPWQSPTDDGSYSIIIVSTVELNADHGDVVAPKLTTAVGGIFAGMPSGARIYAFKTQASYSQWLSDMQELPWVTQGIVSSMVIPDLTRYMPTIFWLADGKPTPLPSGAPIALTHKLAVNFREDVIIHLLPSRYQHLYKFVTSPYSMIELTTLTGNPITCKPELWMNDDADVREVVSLIAPGAKLSFYPNPYNGRSDGFDNVNAEGLDHATHIVNLPTMTIVNNMAISYLASNAYGIPWSKESADWSQQRALSAAQTGYDQASGGMNAARDIATYGIGADISQTANLNRTQQAQALVNNVEGVLGGAIGMGTFGGPKGAMAGAGAGAVSGMAGSLNTAIGVGANNEAQSIRSLLSGGTVNRQNEQGRLVRDTNKSLADWSAKGDYANTIAGINAKVHDSNMIQPGVSGQQGGEIFNFVNGQLGIHLRIKMIDTASIKRIGEFWLRYGYSVQAFMNIPDDFKVMTNFSYWKLTETYITAGPMPEGFKQTIRGIFEKGVTVWNTPSHIGVIDWVTNDPLPGISY